MQIQTTRHNTYTYLRRTNEIVNNVEDYECYAWTFEPLQPFSAMPEVEMVVISITEQCNLRCTYCCYSGKYENNRTHSTHSMSEADIDDVYTFIQKNVSKRPVRIAFYGGEPLTQYHLVQYAVRKGKELMKDDISFTISTNGTLLTTDKIDWLAANDIGIDMSIDGTATFHDAYRIDAAGNGSFSKAYAATSYIKSRYPEFMPNVRLMMTCSSVDNLVAIAEEWHNDEILCDIEPAQISGLAPNFAIGVERKDYEVLKKQYLSLLDVYEQHPDWLVLKAFFRECLAYWHNRPIVEVDGDVPMSTCMPRNNKLYIDAKGKVGVCEKIADRFRIGDIQHGIDYDKSNKLVTHYYNIRKDRCTHCPAIRVCDLCLTAIEFAPEQWDVLCHNERVYAQLHMFLFCEMAERGMLPVPKTVPELHTERCTLTATHTEDIPVLQEIMEDEDTKRFLPELYEVVKTEKGMYQFLTSFQTYLAQDEGILWGIRLNDTLIGFIALMDLTTNATIFYAMHPQHRNRGYMSESIKEVLRYAQETILCNAIQTFAKEDNLISRHLLRKNNFSFEDSDSLQIRLKRVISHDRN